MQLLIRSITKNIRRDALTNLFTMLTRDTTNQHEKISNNVVEHDLDNKGMAPYPMVLIWFSLHQ